MRPNTGRPCGCGFAGRRSPAGPPRTGAPGVAAKPRAMAGAGRMPNRRRLQRRLHAAGVRIAWRRGGRAGPRARRRRARLSRRALRKAGWRETAVLQPQVRSAAALAGTLGSSSTQGSGQFRPDRDGRTILRRRRSPVPGPGAVRTGARPVGPGAQVRILGMVQRVSKPGEAHTARLRADGPA